MLELTSGFIDLKKIVACLKSELHEVDIIYLFGSQVGKQGHGSSDIDLAIKCKKPVALEKLWALSVELAGLAACDVDLVDLSNASTVMRLQIVANGQRLYCSDEKSCTIFEDFVFSDYVRLNEERAAIIEDIELRGTVYG